MDLNINKEQINNLLKIRGQSTELTDEGFQTLYDYCLNNLLMMLGLTSLEPVTYTEKSLYNLYNPHQYLLEHYPITNIESVIITNKYTNYTQELNIEEDIEYDKTTGILKLLNHNIKFYTITITYTSTLPDFIISQITNILTDMILLNSLPNDTGNITSMSEGDLSISYNADNTLAGKINKNINNLINSLNTKAQLI